MEEKELTNEEIVKALECCIDSNCDECPYMKKKIDCAGGRQEKDCIELINRLGGTTTRCSWKNKFLNALKENEELQKKVEVQRKIIEYHDSLQDEVAMLKEERENMQAVIFALEEEKAKIIASKVDMKEKFETELKELSNLVLIEKQGAFWDGVNEGKNKAVKDTAKEIWGRAKHFYKQYPLSTEVGFCCFRDWINERYGVEVE